MRAMLFSEWLFGAGFIRPKAVLALRENQFPEETSEKGHPIIVESYVDAHSIYDGTTYTKGREVFRTLKNYIDMLVPEGFRRSAKSYILAAMMDKQSLSVNCLLQQTKFQRVREKIYSKFERWFHQQGTPVVRVTFDYDARKKLLL